MWIITPLGFFSIVQKPADEAAGTLTVRARVRSDLAKPLKADAKPKAITVPKAGAYGGVLFDKHGRTLLREPLNHFGNYVWTFAKGKPDAGETPEQTALREVLEETGYPCRVVGALQKAFAGSTNSTSAYFLMEATGPQGALDHETAQTRWVDVDEARQLIALTTAAGGAARDLAVLAAAVAAWGQLHA